MKRVLLTVIMMLSCWAGADAQHDFLRRHVQRLADNSMLGRAAGSADARRCAEYIAAQFAEIGLLPAAEDSGDGTVSYLQKFENHTGHYANVVGFLPGSDPVLRDEYIVIGAHYDHIGFRTKGRDTTVYCGADDNASGVAALLEAARRLKRHQGELKRSVIFAAFDAEEVGLYGSRAMAENMALHNVRFMASLDMVGWLHRSGALHIRGTATVSGGDDIFLGTPRDERLQIRTTAKCRSLFYGSDHDTFASYGIPAVLITTGSVSPYHKPQDTAEKIDYDGLELIADYTAALALEMASRDGIEPAAAAKRARKSVSRQKKG